MKLYKVFLEIHPLDVSDNIIYTNLRLDLRTNHESVFLEALKQNKCLLLEIITSKSVHQSLEETLNSFFGIFKNMDTYLDECKFKRILVLQTLFDEEMEFCTIPNRYLEMIQKNNLCFRSSCGFLSGDEN